MADFDGDGNEDYLLFNSGNHQTGIWYLSGSKFLRGAFGPSIPVARPSNGVPGTGRSVRVLLVMMPRLVRPYRGALSQERLRENPEEIVLYDDHFAANWQRSFDWKKRS
jgi:hypothetical protein